MKYDNFGYIVMRIYFNTLVWIPTVRPNPFRLNMIKLAKIVEVSAF